VNSLSTSALLIVLCVLLVISAFFSSSETGIMSLNRYRLRHKADHHKGARLVLEMLARPDRLLGVILTGNNFVNIMASAIATLLFTRWFGDSGILIASLVLTFVVLVFAEVTPKTLAALHPERIAFPAAYILKPLHVFLYPIVWTVNCLSNGLLRLFGVSQSQVTEQGLNRDELRTIVTESRAVIPKRHSHMLLSILDLEKISVDDIMVPRRDVVGIDLDDDIAEILEALKDIHHTRIPLYEGDLNHPIGMLHAKRALKFLSSTMEKTKDNLLKFIAEPYFVPENTPLHVQLAHFQKAKRRIGLVVDEYGDVQGLVTLEDILEEIVGEFTTDITDTNLDIQEQSDQSYLIDCSMSIRDLNKELFWSLPYLGPKTLSGLIIEYLEFVPVGPICLKIDNYCIEVQSIANKRVISARVWDCNAISF